MLFGLLIIAALGTTVTLSNRYFSPAELQDSFEKGQKLYALGDFEKAIKRYKVVLDIESNATIDVEQVSVTVGEFILPVRVAATRWPIQAACVVYTCYPPLTCSVTP